MEAKAAVKTSVLERPMGILGETKRFLLVMLAELAIMMLFDESNGTSDDKANECSSRGW